MTTKDRMTTDIRVGKGEFHLQTSLRIARELLDFFQLGYFLNKD
jgi:hypothetical protein